MTTSARRRRRAPHLASRRGETDALLRVVGWCNLASSALCLLVVSAGWLFGWGPRAGGSVFGLLFALCLGIGVLALRESRAGRGAR